MLRVTDDVRFQTPLYTVSEAARIVGVPLSTFSSWAKGYVRTWSDRSNVTGRPIVSHLPAQRRGDPTIPFVGLAEALVLAAVRESGVPMQRIRPALDALQMEIGLDHALASQKLYTHGAELLFDYGTREVDSDGSRDIESLVVVRNGQHVFVEVVRSYLARITYADDGYASRIEVPAYQIAKVVVDPSHSFGSPFFVHGGAKIDSVLHRFWAGESLEDLSAEYRVPAAELEDVVRVASRQAA